MRYCNIKSLSANGKSIYFDRECSNCGEKLVGYEQYCSQCGNKLTNRPNAIDADIIIGLLNSLEPGDAKFPLPNSKGTPATHRASDSQQETQTSDNTADTCSPDDNNNPPAPNPTISCPPMDNKAPLPKFGITPLHCKFYSAPKCEITHSSAKSSPPEDEILPTEY